MTTLTAQTFSVEVTDALPERRLIWQSLRAESYQPEYEIQNPEVLVGLGLEADLSKFEGETLSDRLISQLRQRSEELVVDEILKVEVDGRESVYLVGSINWEWNEKRISSRCVTAALPMNDGFLYEMKSYCEDSVWDRYQTVFLKLWQSLKTFGDREAAWQEMMAGLDAMAPSADSGKEYDPPQPKEFAIPADGRNLFRIDDHTFSYREETKLIISDFGRDLSVTLKADARESLAGNNALIEEYARDGGVGFRMTFSSIHREGVPTGVFDFKFGKSENRNTYLWDDGWDYSLEFSGQVELREGWLAMNGVLGKEWENEGTHEVEIYHQFDLDALDWSEYRFASLDETTGRPDQEVRFLKLENPDFTAFPQQILAFRELEELSICFPQPFDAPALSPLNQLPEELGSLKKLRSLQITGTSLESLPDSLGELQVLETLIFTHNKITSTPASIWQLPKLKSLHLSQNQLRCLPDAIELPQLKHLNVEKNQLATLPPALAEQPLLKELRLEDNPWESLPASINQIESIGLAIEEKLSLLDFTYPGADGTGCVKWDDAVFLAASNTEFHAKLETHELSEALLKVAKLALTFEHTETDDYQTVGNTRFGGWPDLPESIPYPRFQAQDADGKEQSYAFEFLAQLNCKELAPLQNFLPRDGILYFFLSHHELMQAKVIHWNGDLETLISGKLTELNDDDFFELPDAPYQGYQTKVTPEISLPFSYASYVNTHIFKGAEALLEPEDRLEAIGEQLELNPERGVHEVNSHVFTQHECPELQAALSKKGRPEDWVVLLKVASAGEFQWWDAGELFFVIHKSDLAKGDFSNIYVSLESS